MILLSGSFPPFLHFYVLLGNPVHVQIEIWSLSSISLRTFQGKMYLLKSEGLGVTFQSLLERSAHTR